MQSEQKSYQVLARKYRPRTFEELVGQEVLVRSLTNAIHNQKLAHGFILTGIRGVGKTTTARIIAKALNCIGEKGDAKEVCLPCGVCASCTSIAASKFQDVIEIDAASRTGVDDIREIIDSVSYAPVSGRYKVYIIDEVHMLSNNAFNALLKTLEEPPAHIKFIFATTEIRKVPITVLSRCQRFDLRRLGAEELAEHLAKILQKENFTADENALKIIARAAEGSVRDALSILDRALSHNNYGPNLSSEITAEIVGLSDKTQIIDLFELLLKGNIREALQLFQQFYQNSGDVINLARDLLEVAHQATITKTWQSNDNLDLSAAQKEKIAVLAAETSIANLVRVWQMLLRGLGELNNFDNHKIIFEMLMMRICYLAELPNLSQIINNLETKISAGQAGSGQSGPGQAGSGTAVKIAGGFSAEADLVGEIMRNFPGAKIVS